MRTYTIEGEKIMLRRRRDGMLIEANKSLLTNPEFDVVEVNPQTEEVVEVTLPNVERSTPTKRGRGRPKKNAS